MWFTKQLAEPRESERDEVRKSRQHKKSVVKQSHHEFTMRRSIV